MNPPDELLIGDLIRRNAEAVPQRVAASMGGDALSHRELDELADRIAWLLADAGIGYGDRIVSWADTRLDVLPLFVAAARLGAVFAPLNARLGAEEAAPIIEMARAKLLIADPDHARLALSLRDELAIPQLALLGSSEDAGSFELRIDLRQLPDRTDPYREPRLRERDPHVIFFTSGSTGRPKGVVLSHRANWLRAYQGAFISEPERSVCMFPLFHMAAFTLALAAWQTQGEIVLVSAATPELLLEAVEARRGNRLYCIPAVWNRILETDPARYDTSSLRFIDTGTSATPIELLNALEGRFPTGVLRVYYGATETGAGTTLFGADALTKPGSVGLPAPGVALRLSESGEICLRTPYLMDGYFDDPENSAEALQDGWYKTGDLGVLDDEGYLSVVGRAKEIIRTGGEGVAPLEVEEALRSHPDIAEVAVVGIPDPQWGEVVCAVVIPEPGREPTLSDLQEYCDGRLAAFKKPRRLELVSLLPRTAATNQVQRALIVEQIVTGAVS